MCVLLLTAACALGQTVEGTVVDTITGNGIVDVKVELVRMPDTVSADPQVERQNSIFAMAEGLPAYSATTDRQGRFVVEGVSPGSYTARYRAARHVDETMAPKTQAPLVRRIQVAAGGNPVKVEGRMIPLGGLAGRVVDDKGQPVPNARVDLATGNLMGSQGTDKEGKFADIVFPGTISILSVAPPIGLKRPDPDPDTGRPRTWVRTYYPGVADRAAAGKIVGRPGVWLSDIEIKLVASPTHVLRGTVLNPDGTPVKATVTLGEDYFTPLVKVESKADGSFEFPEAADGLWRISCDVERGDVQLRAAQWVEISGKELEGLKLRLSAQVTVRGRVVMETAQGALAPRPPMVALRAFGHGRMGRRRHRGGQTPTATSAWPTSIWRLPVRRAGFHAAGLLPGFGAAG